MMRVKSPSTTTTTATEDAQPKRKRAKTAVAATLETTRVIASMCANRFIKFFGKVLQQPLLVTMKLTDGKPMVLYMSLDPTLDIVAHIEPVRR